MAPTFRFWVDFGAKSKKPTNTAILSSHPLGIERRRLGTHGDSEGSLLSGCPRLLGFSSEGTKSQGRDMACVGLQVDRDRDSLGRSIQLFVPSSHTYHGILIVFSKMVIELSSS